MDFEEVKEKLRGAVVSMATPMKENYELDLEGLRKNVRFLLENGVTSGKAVLMAVTAAGECPSLSVEERKVAMKVVAEEAKGKVPLVTSAQDCNINTIIELSNYAAELGYDVVQISQPFYYGPSAQVIYRLFKYLSEKIDIGIMVYNTPWLSGGFSIDIDLLGKIVDLDNVVSIKWTSADEVCYLEAYKRYADKVAFLDNTINPLAAHMLGAKMYLAIPGNFAPKYATKIWELMEAGKYPEALNELWRLEIPWYKWIQEVHTEGVRGEGAIIKSSLEMIGLPAGPARPPYDFKLTPDQKSRLRKVLVEGGVKVVK